VDVPSLKGKTVGVAAKDVVRDFGRLTYQGVQDRLEELGAKVVATQADAQDDKHLANVENLVSQKVDAIVVILGDATTLAPALQQAKDADIPVFTIDHASENSVNNIGSDNWQIGSTLARTLAEDIGDNPNAVTRFVLVGRELSIPAPTGADKTSLIVELPDDRAGALLELLEQFSTRGVNMSLLESRPIGDALGRYRFVIDADGHILDERVADSLLGVRRFSPKVIFLGSYPRADKAPIEYIPRYDDDVFIEARDWLRAVISGEPDAD
jgi:hypothetical protein